MATTLLQGVNRVLKRARLIQGASGELTALTSGAFQTDVDIVVDAWNETIRYMYDHDNSSFALPFDTAEGTITMVTDTREYAVAADFERMAEDRMMQRTDGYFLDPYPGGYKAMWRQQFIPTSYTGRATYWAFNPTDETIRLDRIPTSEENGDVYTYLYEKTLYYSLAADVFPFSDTVARNLVPCVKQIWQRETRDMFDANAFAVAMSQAVQMLANVETRSSY